MSPLDLTGRRILVTGASSGIGREIAILFSELKARLVLAGRDRERLEATLSKLHGDGHAVEAFDLAALDEIPRWVKKIAAEGGPLDGLVHSAGLHALVPLGALSVRKLDELMRLNVHAGIILTKAFRQQASGQGGSIVFLSSVTGLAGEAATSAYAATKAALIGAARSLAVELAPLKIRVNAIAPGIVDTEMSRRLWDSIPPESHSAMQATYPLGLGTARDVAHGAAYLMAETGRWVTGTTLVIDGGFTAR